MSQEASSGRHPRSTPVGPTRVFGYIRISKLDAASTSPQRQRQGIEEWCRAHGAELVETFEDLDLSAYRKGVKRPGFDRMMSRLSEADVVVTWRIDRLARSVSGFSKLLEALEAAKTKLATTDGTVDTTTAQGRFTVNLTANLAELEAATTGERSRQMHAFKRANGEPVGRVPYGWRRVGKTYEQDPREQKLLREAAWRFVEGASLSQIARDLGFGTSTLGRLLRSQRVLENLPEDLAGRLAVALKGRAGQRTPASRQSLLAGIARCECGAAMSTGSTRKSGWFAYSCRAAGHVNIAGHWLDAHVSEQVLGAVDTGRLLEALKRRKKVGHSRKASAIEARLEALETAHYVEGTVPAERFARLRDALLEQLKAAQTEERHAGVDLPSELARNLGERWPALSLSARRRIIGAVLERIEVGKASGNGPVDPDRVRLVWRG